MHKYIELRTVTMYVVVESETGREVFQTLDHEEARAKVEGSFKESGNGIRYWSTE